MADDKPKDQPIIGHRPRRGLPAGNQLGDLVIASTPSSVSPVVQTASPSETPANSNLKTMGFKNPIMDGAENDTVSVEFEEYVVPAKELVDKVKVSPMNPRFWVSNEVKHLPLYDDIKAMRKINNPAQCYTIEGQSGIFSADGGTRRAVVLALLEEGIEVDYPVKVLHLKKNQEWIVYDILKTSNINKHFTNIENAKRFLSYAKNKWMNSQRKYIAASQKVHSLTVNGVRFRGWVFIDPVIESLDKIALFKNVSDLSFISQDRLNDLSAFLTGVKIGNFDPLEYLQGSDEQRSKILTISESKLVELNEAINAHKYPVEKDMLQALNRFLSPAPVEPAATKKLAINAEGPDGIFNALDGSHSSGYMFGAFYLKENHTAAEMEKIARVLEQESESVKAIQDVLSEVHKKIEQALSK